MGRASQSKVILARLRGQPFGVKVTKGGGDHYRENLPGAENCVNL